MNQIYVQLSGHPCIHTQETGWQSGMRSCIMPGLPANLMQELNVVTVGIQGTVVDIYIGQVQLSREASGLQRNKVKGPLIFAFCEKRLDIVFFIL